MGKITTIGRIFFAIAIAASGLHQLINAEFVRLVPKLPAWIPWPPFWAGAIGAVLIIAGGAIILDLKRPLAATAVGALLLLSFLVQRVPEVVSNPSVGFMWTNPCKVLALWGGTLLLAGALPGENAFGLRWTEKIRLLSPGLLGVFLLVCGIQHFVYAGFVDTLVPAWIPPRPRFWTCVSGVALTAGGVGILVPRTARPAATWSGIMIFLWVLLLHIPRAVQMKSAFELAGVFEALAISGIAFVVAGTRPAGKG